MKTIPGGAAASFNGSQREREVAGYLIAAGFRFNDYAGSLVGLRNGASLFQDDIQGEFAKQIRVPLVGHAHTGKSRFTVVDFAIVNLVGDFTLLSVKSQMVNGTAEDKLWYEIQQLIDTQIPAAMVAIGPIAGRDAEQGWTYEKLSMMWDLSRYHGKNLLLFRNYKSLNSWLLDGCPVQGRGKTHEDIFKKYCDLEP